MVVSWERYKAYLMNERNLLSDANEVRKNRGVTVYKCRFERVVDWFGDKDFNRENISLFIQHIKQTYKLSPSTVNKFITTLKHISEILEKEDELKRIHREHETAASFDVLTDQEQLLLITTHPPTNLYAMFPDGVRQKLEEKRAFKYDVIFEVFLKCGLRFGEMKYLTWDRFVPVIDDKYGAYLKIEGNKTKRERKVPVLKDLADKIAKLPRYPHNHIFGSDKGLLDNGAVIREQRARLDHAGIKKDINITRRLRTTCGTTLLRHDAAIEKVAKMFGNSPQVLYERYYKEIIDDLVEISYLHPLNAPEARFENVKTWIRKLVDKAQKAHCQIKQFKITKNHIILDIIDADK